MTSLIHYDGWLSANRNWLERNADAPESQRADKRLHVAILSSLTGAEAEALDVLAYPLRSRLMEIARSNGTTLEVCIRNLDAFSRFFTASFWGTKTTTRPWSSFKIRNS